MSKYTLGPWRFYTEPQPNGCQIVGNGKGLMVAMLAHSVAYKDQKEEALANARLIASAPELLEALEEITADYADRFDLDSESTNPGIKIVIRQAREIIAKAKGAA